MKPGDRVMVSVDGRVYDTEIDSEGVQRFKLNAAVRYLTERANGGLDLNRLALAYQAGRFSEREYLELNMMLGYSVTGIGDLFPDLSIENPLWHKKAGVEGSAPAEPSMRESTSGPLSTIKRMDGDVEITDENGSVLATVHGDDEDTNCWPVTANAQLFARAPDMKATLQQAFKALEEIDTIACRVRSSGSPEDLPEPVPADGQELVSIVRPVAEAIKALFPAASQLGLCSTCGAKGETGNCIPFDCHCPHCK